MRVVGSAMISAAAVMAATIGATTAQAEPKVVVTIKPVHGLVSRVMEGVGTPSLLVTGSASPHTFAMKPSDARALSHADVFFRVSEAVEPFTGKVVQSLPERVRVVTLTEAPGVELLDMRTGGTFEAHAHGHDEKGLGHDADDEDHDHDEHDHEAAATRDGHIWLNPDNAKAMVGEIVRVLADASPKDAPKLKENAAKLSAEIDSLKAELQQDLKPVTGKPFVVFHDAYQYFERSFGLTAVGSITVNPEGHPSAKRLTELRAKIGTLSATCVFAEPQFQPRLVETVIEGTKARTGTLDPIGAGITPGSDAYFTLMRNLGAGFKDCLHQGS